MCTVSRGYLYVAAKDRIIRFSLSDFSEETVISGLGDVIGIAVDYKNNVVSTKDYIHFHLLCNSVCTRYSVCTYI